MYDSYSEVSCLDDRKSMTRDEDTEFVIQRSLFLNKLNKEEEKDGVKGAATAAGVSAVMQARTMSKVGKSLMSGGNKI